MSGARPVAVQVLGHEAESRWERSRCKTASGFEFIIIIIIVLTRRGPTVSRRRRHESRVTVTVRRGVAGRGSESRV